MKMHYTMMCALGNSTPATDACNGDSGGALYDKQKDKVSTAFKTMNAEYRYSYL